VGVDSGAQMAVGEGMQREVWWGGELRHGEGAKRDLH